MISLKQHQREAVNRLKNGNILCGGVGTGKSVTALAYYFTKVCNGNLGSGSNSGVFSISDYIPVDGMTNPTDLYIITTAQKRDKKEWEYEMLYFCLSSNPEENYHGVNVTVDSWNNIKKYVDIKDAFFIFDEQRVVGSGTWVKSFLKIAKSNQWILLTATPGDTWSDYIPVFIANGFYRNRTEFLQRHAVYSRYVKYRIDRYVETKRLHRLKNEITVYMTYNKKTVPHPENYISEYDRALYKRVMKDRWNVYEDEPIEQSAQLCYILRRVANSDPSKIDAVKEIMKKHNKLIIFYNFDYELEELRKIEGIKIAEWNGHKHEEVPSDNRWLYLVQYTAGCEGWNCVTTNAIIFFSLNYSYKAMTQAAGRIDRLNTPYSDLYYYYIYSNSPIDLAIQRCLKKKKNFNEREFVENT